MTNPLIQENRKSILKEIAEGLGGHIEHDEYDLLALDRTLGIKFMIDVNKPLLERNNDNCGKRQSNWVDSKYERASYILLFYWES